MTTQPETRPVAADAAALALVEQQRQQQVALGAEAMAAFVALWPAFLSAYAANDLRRWFRQLAPVVAAYGAAGWRLSRRQYLDLRRLAAPGGLEPSMPQLEVDTYRLWLDMRDHVIRPYTEGLAAGVSPADLQPRVRLQGARRAQKHALEPGRRLVQEAVDKAATERGAPLPPGVEPARPGEVDRQLIGWVRTTDGDPCYFCGMLAARGAVYASFESAQYRKDGEEYHPNCGCKAYPIWSDNPSLPEINYEMELLWREAQTTDVPGERLDQQKPREGSGNLADVAGRQARNNFRRLLAQRARETRRRMGAPDEGP